MRNICCLLMVSVSFLLMSCAGGRSIASGDHPENTEVEPTPTQTSPHLWHGNNEQLQDFELVDPDKEFSAEELEIAYQHSAETSGIGECMAQADMQTAFLRLVNRVRATPTQCGNEWYPPVEAVAWDEKLASVAKQHVVDMAKHDFFDHAGSNGLYAGARARAQGYAYSKLSENIAVGYPTPQYVVEGWLRSEGHCRNLMDPDVLEMGVSCWTNPKSVYKVHWAQVFGFPDR